ncbi:MAG TPA: insulinase family protein, partial [Vicinamibacteria bacterium]|nr:insulinase family protein [Vicinamibacteria bacterium]
MKARAVLLTALVLAAAAPAWPQAAPIPSHPGQLTFSPIAYDPPRAADHRVVLKNGMVVYIAEDRTLPLVNISLLVRTGSYLEPAGKAGLAGLTGQLIRRGGTRRLTAEQLDERLDHLAANVSTSISDTTGSASLNCLRDNLDESLALFVEMLKEPRFQEDRLKLAREQAIQDLERRNDDPEDIERLEWNV